MTLSDFQEQLHLWHDLFLTAGTAAATLLGLLFVAVSLNSDSILSADRLHLKQLAEQAYHNYVSVLLVTFLMLMPTSSRRGLAYALTAVAAIMITFTVWRLVALSRISDDRIGRGRSIRRVAPAAMAYLGMALGAFKLGDQPEGDGLTLVTFSVVVLIVAATATAWDLLVRVAAARRAVER